MYDFMFGVLIVLLLVLFGSVIYFCLRMIIPLKNTRKSFFIKSISSALAMLVTFIILMAVESQRVILESEEIAAKEEIERQSANQLKDEERSKEIAKQVERSRQEQETIECRKDLICWAGRSRAFAERVCPDRIESYSQYQFKWINGFFSSKFSDYKWGDEKSGSVILMGDALQFQNGFGAWQNIVYACEVNIDTSSIGVVEVVAGRL
jgi:hypothetical protein